MCKSHRINSLYALAHVSLLALGSILTPHSLQASPPSKSSLFRGSGALAYTQRAVSYGERPSGSEALNHFRDWLRTELKSTGGELSLDSFTSSTPTGSVPMVNLILKFPGVSGRIVAVTGHYDTKKIPMVRFVGANDGGSSAGFLVEFAHAISKVKHRDDIYIVFFDGEEAVGTWSNTDSLYGSRHLASQWGSDGTLSRVKALINIDMIGDKDLDIMNDGNSSQALRDQVLKIATTLSYGKYFQHQVSGVDDDHRPFVDAGVNAIDIIDLDYGPGSQTYWHTGDDTMDKLSAHSFQVVGDVVLGLVKELESE